MNPTKRFHVHRFVGCRGLALIGSVIGSEALPSAVLAQTAPSLTVERANFHYQAPPLNAVRQESGFWFTVTLKELPATEFGAPNTPSYVQANGPLCVPNHTRVERGLMPNPADPGLNYPPIWPSGCKLTLWGADLDKFLNVPNSRVECDNNKCVILAPMGGLPLQPPM